MKIEKSLVLILLLSAMVFLCRMLPHEANFSPLLALFLIAGFVGKNKWYSLFLPLMALTLSDLYLGSYPGWAFTYTPMILIVLMGHYLKKSYISFLSMGLSSALLFFLVSNFGVWYSTLLYPKNFQGLLTCYEMALPFFRISTMGTLIAMTFFYGIRQVYVKLIDRETMKSAL
jgi:hypothetical protein